MRNLFALLALGGALLTAAPGQAAVETSRSLTISQDKAWIEVLKFAAAHGMTAQTTDRASGRIVLTGDRSPGLYITCPVVRRIQPGDYAMTVMLAPEGADQTTVIVTVDGAADLVRRKHFLFIPGHHVKREYDCPTTGALEGELFQALQAAAG